MSKSPIREYLLLILQKCLKIWKNENTKLLYTCSLYISKTCYIVSLTTWLLKILLVTHTPGCEVKCKIVLYCRSYYLKNLKKMDFFDSLGMTWCCWQVTSCYWHVTSCCCYCPTCDRSHPVVDMWLSVIVGAHPYNKISQ